MRKATQTLALASMMTAVMMVLGYIESLLPVSSVPGIKLGLANSVLVIALYWLDVKTCFMVMTVRVVLTGLLFGNPMMILYSMAGGTLSLAVMALLKRCRGVSPVGVGMAGGAMHNVGQVAIAALVLQTSSILTYLAILLPVGAGMGFLTGTVARLLSARAKRLFSVPETHQ
ncbi:MAG: Gx transporter family protein [Eubacteriales bacterium]|nr:Gx transporter family protein [Eubacteriales bacterium]